MRYLHIVWRNLLRRKIRTIFTVLSIFVAFVLFGILMAVRAAFSMGIDLAGADRLMVLNKISLIMPLPGSYQQKIRELEGVKDVTHANWFGGYYQETKNQFANMAVDPESWLRMYPEFAITEDEKKAWLDDRQGAIVGIDTAKRFGWKVGDRVPLQATFMRRPDGSAWEFNIRGIYDSPVKGTDKTQLFFHYAYLNESLRTMTTIANQVGWYVIKVDEPDQSPAIAKKIDQMFANSQDETKTDSEKAFVAGFAKQIGNISLITQLIASAAIFMILIVTANTMAQSIRERTSELAVLKTLGFGDGRVLSMVLLESCLIALLGGGLGLALSWFIVSLGDPTGGFLPMFYFPVKDLIAGIVLVLLLGVVAGAFPAWQAGRLRIVDALRRN
jgi:putative ABC transport system permease protein